MSGMPGGFTPTGPPHPHLVLPMGMQGFQTLHSSNLMTLAGLHSTNVALPGGIMVPISPAFLPAGHGQPQSQQAQLAQLQPAQQQAQQSQVQAAASTHGFSQQQQLVLLTGGADGSGKAAPEKGTNELWEQVDLSEGWGRAEKAFLDADTVQKLSSSIKEMTRVLERCARSSKRAVVSGRRLSDLVRSKRQAEPRLWTRDISSRLKPVTNMVKELNKRGGGGRLAALGIGAGALGAVGAAGAAAGSGDRGGGHSSGTSRSRFDEHAVARRGEEDGRDQKRRRRGVASPYPPSGLPLGLVSHVGNDDPLLQKRTQTVLAACADDFLAFVASEAHRGKTLLGTGGVLNSASEVEAQQRLGAAAFSSMFKLYREVRKGFDDTGSGEGGDAPAAGGDDDSVSDGLSSDNDGGGGGGGDSDSGDRQGDDEDDE